MEAIFDFKDINRRMNRKPLMAAVEVVASDPVELAKNCIFGNEDCPICNAIPNVYSGIDLAKKGSDQTIISVYDPVTDKEMSFKRYTEEYKRYKEALHNWPDKDFWRTD